MRRTSKISRNDRLNGEFQKEIYEIISRRLKNPLVTEMFSILRVDCSRDLSYAKVYVSVYSTDEGKKKATFDAIASDAKKGLIIATKDSSIELIEIQPEGKRRMTAKEYLIGNKI